MTSQPTLAHLPPELPVDLIDPAHYENPRGDIDTDCDEYTALVDSIRDQGVLQPIAVASPTLEGTHPLVAGWRRYAAAIAAGLETIPVRELSISDAKDALAAAIAENVARQPMRPLAEARAIEKLIGYGLNQAEAAHTIGLSESTVRERRRLLKLPETVSAAIDTGKVPAGVAPVLLKIGDKIPTLAEALVDELAKDECTWTAEDIRDPYLLGDDILYDLEQETGPLVANLHHTVNLDHVPLTGEARERLQEFAKGLTSWDMRWNDDDRDAARAAGILVELSRGDHTLSLVGDQEWLADRLEIVIERAQEDLAKRKADQAERAAEASDGGQSEWEAQRKRQIERDRITNQARKDANAELEAALEQLRPVKVDIELAKLIVAGRGITYEKEPATVNQAFWPLIKQLAEGAASRSSWSDFDSDVGCEVAELLGVLPDRSRRALKLRKDHDRALAKWEKAKTAWGELARRQQILGFVEKHGDREKVVKQAVGYDYDLRINVNEQQVEKVLKALEAADLIVTEPDESFALTSKGTETLAIDVGKAPERPEQASPDEALHREAGVHDEPGIDEE